VDSCKLTVSSFQELNIKLEIWHNWNGVTDPKKSNSMKLIGQAIFTFRELSESKAAEIHKLMRNPKARFLD
jgi:hypothetical protein